MTTDRPLHSKIGASSMHRWKNCPGSVALCEGEPNVSSIAAQEGTAAHELVALALERAFSENRPTLEVLHDTIKALSVYTGYIESIKKDNPVHIEHSFDMCSIYPNLYGTADCVVFDHATDTLHVIDYKHGVGVVVEAKNNLQGSYYALGALTTLPYKPKYVQITIVQPRAYHPDGPIRHWKVPVIHFIDFQYDLVEAAKETEKKNAKLKSGDHCMFCRAKTKCPEIANKNIKQAKSEFSPIAFYRDPAKDFEVLK